MCTVKVKVRKDARGRWVEDVSTAACLFPGQPCPEVRKCEDVAAPPVLDGLPGVVWVPCKCGV